MAAFWPLMFTQEQAVKIRVMARRGEGIRQMALQSGCSRNTGRYLREQTAARYGPRAPWATKLDPLEECLPGACRAPALRGVHPAGLAAAALVLWAGFGGDVGAQHAIRAVVYGGKQHGAVR